MPDFTNLDPSLVASFWIYFIGSFVIGIIVGVLVSKLFFHREKTLFEQEKNIHKEKLAQFEDLETKLATKNEELLKLQERVSKNELFWNLHKNEHSEARGDKALYNAIHKANEN